MICGSKRRNPTPRAMTLYQINKQAIHKRSIRFTEFELEGLTAVQFLRIKEPGQPDSLEVLMRISVCYEAIHSGDSSSCQNEDLTSVLQECHELCLYGHIQRLHIPPLASTVARRLRSILVLAMMHQKSETYLIKRSALESLLLPLSSPVDTSQNGSLSLPCCLACRIFQQMEGLFLAIRVISRKLTQVCVSLREVGIDDVDRTRTNAKDHWFEMTFDLS